MTAYRNQCILAYTASSSGCTDIVSLSGCTTDDDVIGTDWLLHLECIDMQVLLGCTTDDDVIGTD